MTARQHTQQTQGTTSHQRVWSKVAKALQTWSDKWNWVRSPRDRPPTKPPTGRPGWTAALALIAYDALYWLLPPLRPWLERTFPGF